jgi:hypothetical protein
MLIARSIAAAALLLPLSAAVACDDFAEEQALAAAIAAAKDARLAEVQQPAPGSDGQATAEVRPPRAAGAAEVTETAALLPSRP